MVPNPSNMQMRSNLLQDALVLLGDLLPLLLLVVLALDLLDLLVRLLDVVLELV